MKEIAKPFLKWAGGKAQLLPILSARFPDELRRGEITTYLEPFVGGGAVLFFILQSFDIQKAIIVDQNKELMNCYRCIKENAGKLIERLAVLQSAFYASEQKSVFFLDVRERYNGIVLNGHCDYEKAADFIFLNKTCFNGLYRVNRKGAFNVPFGKGVRPLICDKKNLILVHRLLQRVELHSGDYRLCGAFVDDRSFVYFDPPYRPITETQSFVAYVGSGFDDGKQRELAEFMRELDAKGAKIMLSNSDPKNVNPEDNFFENLYDQFWIDRIYARRMINCQADKRGSVTEIVVTNFATEALTGGKIAAYD